MSSYDLKAKVYQASQVYFIVDTFAFPWVRLSTQVLGRTPLKKCHRVADLETCSFPKIKRKLKSCQFWWWKWRRSSQTVNVHMEEGRSGRDKLQSKLGKGFNFYFYFYLFIIYFLVELWITTYIPLCLSWVLGLEEIVVSNWTGSSVSLVHSFFQESE